MKDLKLISIIFLIVGALYLNNQFWAFVLSDDTYVNGVGTFPFTFISIFLTTFSVIFVFFIIGVYSIARVFIKD